MAAVIIDDEDIPNVTECDRLCKEFTTRTKTNDALAQSVLQDHKWNLEESLKAYEKDNAGEGPSGEIKENENRLHDDELIDLSNDVDDIIDATSGTSLQQELRLEFMNITQSDAKDAQSYLERHDWNLSASINAYLENSTNEPSKTRKRSGEADEGDKMSSCMVDLLMNFFGGVTSIPTKRPRNESSTKPSFTYRMAGNKERENPAVHLTSNDAGASTSAPDQRTFKLISWNIDGLDNTSFQSRANAVCAEILKEKPDVVFLQEVVPDNQFILGSQLSEIYEFIVGSEMGYFSNILLKRGIVKYEGDALIDFGHFEGKNLTNMARNLIIVRAKFYDVSLTLMTSHLESTKEDGGFRAKQLRICFDTMIKEDSSRVVIFGGDLNMRETDVKKAGGIPNNISDLWQECGSRKECANTWDMKRNTNIASKVDFHGKFAPICRFDRLYFRHGSTLGQLKPIHFGLVGLEKVPQSQLFPSDHWGILCDFDRV